MLGSGRKVTQAVLRTGVWRSAFRVQSGELRAVNGARQTPNGARQTPANGGASPLTIACTFTDYSWTISKRQTLLQHHVESLAACRKCPKMQSKPVSGSPVLSRVMLIGQAPGVKEPILGRPFAWTAGKEMFKWFEQEIGINETEFRRSVYMAAVCRCFPGKNSQGGDRIPSREEVTLCSEWLRAELAILKPRLVIAVGKLAISQFLNDLPGLTEIVGKIVRVEKFGRTFDLVPLPHPSGASPWHRIEPGKTLTKRALALIRNHPAWIGRV